MKILIADDNANVRQLMRALLASRATEKHQPDWVVMDVQMEPMDGITATRQILSRFPSARIVTISAFDATACRRSAKSAGARAFVAKDELWRVPGLMATASSPE
jgi:CheY-like chemotaxis protein